MHPKNMDLRTSSIGISLIKKYEGWSPTAYRCPSGHLTCCWGHLIRKSEMIEFKNRTFTKEEGTEVLKKDLIREENGVKRLVKVPLTQNEFDALVSWTFNLGIGNLASSTLLKTLNRGHKNLVTQQIKRWVYAGGRRLKGLVRRRQAEIQLWNSYYTYSMAEMFAKYLGR